MGATKKGRASIFRGKKNGKRVQGIVTFAGGREFERRRKELAELAERDVGDVSDADTIEFLARGTAATLAYLLHDGK